MPLLNNTKFRILEFFFLQDTNNNRNNRDDDDDEAMSRSSGGPTFNIHINVNDIKLWAGSLLKDQGRPWAFPGFVMLL